MSQRNRHVLAAAGLAALLFAAPVPAQAAGVREGEAAAALVARAWSWLEGLGLAPRLAVPPRRGPAAREKASLFQGSAIDPNGGAARLSTYRAPSDQGSAIDPNGGW